MRCVCSEKQAKFGALGGIRVSDYTCYNCNRIEEVMIPDTVTYIGYDAFALTKFESITIPSSVKSISKSAFYLADLKNLELSE